MQDNHTFSLTKLFKTIIGLIYSSKFGIFVSIKAITALIFFVFLRILICIYCTILSITPSFIVQLFSNTFDTKFSSNNSNYYLITLPYSHYCEKARWILEKSNIKYTEEGYAPFWALIILFYTNNVSKTVPKLIIPFNERSKFNNYAINGILMDSNEISMYCHYKNKLLGLFGDNETDFQQIKNLEMYFDRNFGQKCFALAYYYLYKNKNSTQLLINAQSKGLRWAKLQNLTKFIWGDSCKFILWNIAMRFDDDKCLSSYRKHVNDTFDKVNKLLSDGRKYLIKDYNHLTVADISFACLAAPMLLPDQWTKARFISFNDPLLPNDYKQEIIIKRNTLAGKYALRLWKQQRAIVQTNK